MFTPTRRLNLNWIIRGTWGKITVDIIWYGSNLMEKQEMDAKMKVPMIS